LAARILRDSSDSLRRVLWISAPLAAALGGIFLLGADRIAERIDSVSVSEALLASAPLIGTGLVLAAAVALAARRFESIAIAGLALMPIMVIIGGQRLIEALGEQRSAREMSRVVEKAIPDDTRIIGINTYPSSLSYYLEANVHLATLYGTELRSNYILDYLEQLRAQPDTTLRPQNWWFEQLEHCQEPTLFILSARSGWEPHRKALEDRLPLLYENHLYRVYGPCDGKS
jgi:hypothetical protein